MNNQSFSEDKKIVEQLSALGATEYEIKDLAAKIKNHKSSKANQHPKEDYSSEIDEVLNQEPKQGEDLTQYLPKEAPTKSSNDKLSSIIDDLENDKTWQLKASIYGEFEYLWNEKSFRSIILRHTASLINEETPIKIDEVTYLIKVEAHEDRSFSYKYRINFTYDKGKKFFDGYKETLHQDIKKYWCYDKKAADFRKMKVIVFYEYFSKDMSPIGSYTIDIGKECY